MKQKIVLSEKKLRNYIKNIIREMIETDGQTVNDLSNEELNDQVAEIISSLDYDVFSSANGEYYIEIEDTVMINGYEPWNETEYPATLHIKVDDIIDDIFETLNIENNETINKDILNYIKENPEMVKDIIENKIKSANPKDWDIEYGPEWEDYNDL